ncbi:MAG: YybH family protein [Draconibacterium sp.]
MENVRDEIILGNEKFLKAFNNGNAKEVATNYVDGAKLFPPNSDIVEGLKNIEAFWQGAMNMGIKSANLKTVKAEGYENVAIEEGRYKLFLENGQVADQGKYIVIWRNTAEGWKLDQDIWNSSNPTA